jgi:hypothetical protein
MSNFALAGDEVVILGINYLWWVWIRKGGMWIEVVVHSLVRDLADTGRLRSEHGDFYTSISLNQRKSDFVNAIDCINH